MATSGERVSKKMGEPRRLRGPAVKETIIAGKKTIWLRKEHKKRHNKKSKSHGKLSEWIICLFCGVGFNQKRKNQKFCCREHRVKWHSKNRLKLIKEKKICPFCGEEYEPKTYKSSNCGKGKCQTKAWRLKKASQ